MNVDPELKRDVGYRRSMAYLMVSDGKDFDQFQTKLSG